MFIHRTENVYRTKARTSNTNPMLEATILSAEPVVLVAVVAAVVEAFEVVALPPVVVPPVVALPPVVEVDPLPPEVDDPDVVASPVVAAVVLELAGTHSTEMNIPAFIGLAMQPGASTALQSSVGVKVPSSTWGQRLPGQLSPEMISKSQVVIRETLPAAL